MSRAETPALPEDDARLLRRFEYLLVALVVLLVAAGGRDAAWPFIVWPMYAGSHPPPPRRVSETELRLLSRDGEVMRLLPARLFTHADIELGRRIAADAFVEQPCAQQYRAVLLRCLRPLLEERDVVEIQGWTLSWTTDPTAVPPFDLALPEEEIMLGRMRVLNDVPPAQRRPPPLTGTVDKRKLTLRRAQGERKNPSENKSSTAQAEPVEAGFVHLSTVLTVGGR